jgi:alpha-mannosidase
VDAQLELSSGSSAPQVFDAEGKSVPTQVIANEGGKCHFIFLAKVPSVGFAVFSVKESPATPTASLKVSERSLENARYRVTLNDAGDIGSVYDKAAGRELLSQPARLAFQSENSTRYPAWNMDWKDRTNAPRGYVDGPAKFSVVENGPVRVAIQVEREAENSIFTQTIRLAAGGAGDRVEVANKLDWQSKGCSLRAMFPLTVANPLATYNWDLGKIQRGDNDPKKYEVPSHQWFDLTDASGRYGVSILNDTKYGSDKPSDDVVRLTLLYTPTTIPRYYQEQRWQDWGLHEFIYGIYGHIGDWREGKSDWAAARLGQPLLAFRTASHPGKLGRGFSLLQVSSDDVAVRAIKLAENSDQVIVRLQELDGKRRNGVTLTAVSGVDSATEVNGFEQTLAPLKAGRGKLKLSFGTYQLRSLALTPRAPLTLAPPASAPVELPYNLDVFSSRGVKPGGAFDETGATYPSEMIEDAVEAEGVRFQIAPRTGGSSNAVACEDQTIQLPGGDHNRLFLLAASAGGDSEGVFKVDDQATALRVQDWTGYIGQWDNRVFKGTVPELSYSITNELDHINAGFIKRDPLAWFSSHRRLADGSDDIYRYCYLFKYKLPLPAGAKTLTLPNNPHIRVFAVTATQDDNAATQTAWPLYDDFTGRAPVELRGDLK